MKSPSLCHNYPLLRRRHLSQGPCTSQNFSLCLAERKRIVGSRILHIKIRHNHSSFLNKHAHSCTKKNPSGFKVKEIFLSGNLPQPHRISFHKITDRHFQSTEFTADIRKFLSSFTIFFLRKYSEIKKALSKRVELRDLPKEANLIRSSSSGVTGKRPCKSIKLYYVVILFCISAKCF